MNFSELLQEYVFGTLNAEDRERVERALAESPSLRTELRELEAAASLFAREEAPLLRPPPSVRARVLDALDGEQRYAPFFDRLSELLDLSIDRVRALLASMSAPNAWGRGPCPGAGLIHFQAGPAAMAADAGFVRVPAGVTFPMHKHHGRERALVLQGSYVELETNLIVRTGELSTRETGSEHSFRALDGPDLIFAVVLEAPIEINGKKYG